MQKISCIFVISLLICGAVAQKGEPVITVPQKATPTTPPHPVAESDRTKQCPAGFDFLGKQCAKTLTASPDVVCPAGTSLVDGRCAKYVGKLSECPAGYTPSKGTCTRTTASEAEIICPNGYTLSGKDSCVIKVALPSRTVCPSGSLSKGDGCVRTGLEAPQYVCAEGYSLQGQRCQREETYDCTPTRATTPAPSGKNEVEHQHNHFRNTAPGKGKGESHIYTLHEAAPIVEEYVISETCKRIITESARRLCPHGGAFNGSGCLTEIPVEPITKNGGYRDEFVPATRQCPLGYNEAGPAGQCQATEEVLPSLFCPANTIDLGARCAIYSHPRTVCPTGFSLEGPECLRTIFAAPIVEYTVTYSCTGKDCGDNQGTGHGHAHGHGHGHGHAY